MANEKVISEADLKLAVAEYLEYGTNQGKWYADRLNSGAVIIARGDVKYKIQLCREGTADFIVLTKYQCGLWIPRIIFLEVKSLKGKQRAEQSVFQKLVEEQLAEYKIIHSIEELEEVLK